MRPGVLRGRSCVEIVRAEISARRNIRRSSTDGVGDGDDDDDDKSGKRSEG
jgi:hypothetical protein